MFYDGNYALMISLMTANDDHQDKLNTFLEEQMIKSPELQIQ